MKEGECSEAIFGERGFTHQCLKKPTKYENNKWWCTIHSPSYLKRQMEARNEKFRADRAKDQERYRRQDAIDKLVEGISTEFIEQNPGILRGQK